MSPAVPHGLSGTEIAKALERAGFGHIATRGSHAKYRKDGRTVIVPLHRSLAPGTLRHRPRRNRHHGGVEEGRGSGLTFKKTHAGTSTTLLAILGRLSALQRG